MKVSLFIRLIILFIIACFSMSLTCEDVLAQEGSSNTVTRELTGYGNTRELAVVNGLIEAIQQIKGVKISSLKKLESSLVEMMKEKNGVEHNNSDFRASQQSDILSETEGQVKSYEVLSFERRGDGLGWGALLRVEIPVYNTPGISPDTRRKMAVMPFRSVKARYESIESYIPSVEVSRQLVQNLVTEFTQTRKFTVLDRDYVNEYLKEKNLLLSPDASVNELSKIGEVLGVDYMVVGNVSDFNIREDKYTIDVSGETGYDLSASMLVEYRIIVMATRQIKWSDSVTISLHDADLQNLISDFRQDTIQQALIGVAAKNIVYSAMDNIYPIRIVKVEPNGNLILNQGGVSLNDGEILEVYTIGENLRDPYTGESLGAAENWAASVEITRVTPKMSYAEILQGDSTGIKNGDICRRIKKVNYQPEVSARRKSDVRTYENGGVALPYDH